MLCSNFQPALNAQSTYFPIGFNDHVTLFLTYNILPINYISDYLNLCVFKFLDYFRCLRTCLCWSLNNEHYKVTLHIENNYYLTLQWTELRIWIHTTMKKVVQSKGPPCRRQWCSQLQRRTSGSAEGNGITQNNKAKHKYLQPRAVELLLLIPSMACRTKPIVKTITIPILDVKDHLTHMLTACTT